MLLFSVLCARVFVCELVLASFFCLTAERQWGGRKEGFFNNLNDRSHRLGVAVWRFLCAPGSSRSSSQVKDEKNDDEGGGKTIEPIKLPAPPSSVYLLSSVWLFVLSSIPSRLPFDICLLIISSAVLRTSLWVLIPPPPPRPLASKLNGSADCAFFSFELRHVDGKRVASNEPTDTLEWTRLISISLRSVAIRLVSLSFNSWRAMRKFHLKKFFSFFHCLFLLLGYLRLISRTHTHILTICPNRSYCWCCANGVTKVEFNVLSLFLFFLILLLSTCASVCVTLCPAIIRIGFLDWIPDRSGGQLASKNPLERPVWMTSCSWWVVPTPFYRLFLLAFSFRIWKKTKKIPFRWNETKKKRETRRFELYFLTRGYMAIILQLMMTSRWSEPWHCYRRHCRCRAASLKSPASESILRLALRPTSPICWHSSIPSAAESRPSSGAANDTDWLLTARRGTAATTAKTTKKKTTKTKKTTMMKTTTEIWTRTPRRMR